MPYRKVIFANKEIYHVVNQGVAKESIFRGPKDYQRAFLLIDFYRHSQPALRFSHHLRQPKEKREAFFKDLKKAAQIVEIIAFCLMPNHFHFLLRQLIDKGISRFMANLQNSYARYFNLKYKRTGPLFSPLFKAIRIETDEQLVHVSRYIHLNPSTSFIVEIKDLEDYKWSSLPTYLKLSPYYFVNPEPVLNHFPNVKNYRQFVFDQADYQRKLQKIKQFLLEKP